MSIRTNPKKAVPLLLKRLRTVEPQENLEDLKSVLINIKDIFSLVKKNEEELLDTLSVVDGYIRKSNIDTLMKEKKDICTRIMDSAQKLLPGDAIQSSNTEATKSSSKSLRDLNIALPSSQLQDFEKYEDLEVLHLGRWLQHSASHHIEVESEEFLKELTDHKYLKYLSLRGISRISEIPTCIFQLEGLETLDLKACHNLETLPNDIASLKKLKHLDLSECYLLGRMPKGIEKLTELRVLKGFVIDSSSKTPYKISDLENLKKLEKLSIHIGSEAVIQDGDFERLKDLSTLHYLKISWGVSTATHTDVKVILPSNLEKLHLEGFPGQNFPKWLKPGSLPFSLKELNISGGKLNNMEHGEIYDKLPWLNILRLKYLNHLNVNLKTLHMLFPSLWFVEIKHVLNYAHFEWGIEWGDSERS
ncbi:hypothetical protein PHAVU_002G074500 [Phaseolus vulgaris]